MRSHLTCATANCFSGSATVQRSPEQGHGEEDGNGQNDCGNDGGNKAAVELRAHLLFLKVGKLRPQVNSRGYNLEDDYCGHKSKYRKREKKHLFWCHGSVPLYEICPEPCLVQARMSDNVRKAEPVLIIEPYALLAFPASFPASFQRLKAVPGRTLPITKFLRTMNHDSLRRAIRCFAAGIDLAYS